MPELVNTSPLQNTALPPAADDKREIVVAVNSVSMVFNMASEQLNSLKEYAIALAKRELLFKEFRALDDVSFTVRKGDVFGILGTNGSGKSTMLKIVAGVLEPSSGTCEINGNIAPLIELGAGFDLELTARENIYLNGALLGYSKKFIEQHFDEIVDFAEIESFLDMPMKNYSSGMVARIAFAIATVIIPDILIVDEVLSVGDFMFQQKCENRITKLIKEHDVTVLIVSHDNDQIERLCNKAIWIEKGHARMMGDANEVCNSYRILGGRKGNPESEQRVFSMLKSKNAVPERTISTLAGEDRYASAIKIMSEADFSSETVILVSDTFNTTCVLATSLSSLFDAPVFPIRNDLIPDIVNQALKAFTPQNVILLSNEKPICQTALKEIKEACGQNTSIVDIHASRLSQLAIDVYNHGLTVENTWGETAAIACDDRFGELISISPYLYMKKIPLFLRSDEAEKNKDVIEYLLNGSFKKLLLLDGPDRTPNEKVQPLIDMGIEVVRLYGGNPYFANDAINEWITDQTSEQTVIDKTSLIICSAKNPLDAFSAGPYAGKKRSLFLFDDPSDLDSVAHALDYIGRNAGTINHLTFLGGRTIFCDLDKQILGKAVVQDHEK